MAAPVQLEARADRPAPRAFRQGTRPPYAIRWYGATSMLGHFRALVSTAIASESVDTRDWMRALPAEEMLAGVVRALGVDRRATLVESLGRPLWIDWVADTGDDHDVSQAVARMVFAEYVVRDDAGPEPLALPRGDVLLFGGDTAYPVATADEIQRRLVRPWNEALREGGADRPDKPRVLLGIPGNHDWYDGLDGFGRLFRRRADSMERNVDQGTGDHERGHRRGRGAAAVARGLHLDEVGSAVRLTVDALKTANAVWRGTTLSRRRRLALRGYEPVQESSYWALPLAPGLDLWGVDRQLRRMDYRQRGYFHARRRVIGEDAAVWLAAPDPAIAFGEPWEPGVRMLAACGVSLERDRVLYQCGDMHQYERRVVARSLHVIAGGGGAFLHGTRIVPDPNPAASAYPTSAMSRRLALQVPLKLMIGRAGYLVHIAAAAVSSLILGVGWHNRTRLAATSVVVSLVITWALYAIVGHKRAHPRRALAIAIPFGAALGLLPMGLSALLHGVARFVPLLGRDTAVTVACAFAGAFLFGTFLSLCALGGLEMQQVFTVLGHPGFKHFVRMRVSEDGTIDAWVIGKDDPLVPEGPWLIDRFRWSPRT